MNALRFLANQLGKSLRGQTVAEYAFVVVAIAIAVFATYELMGQHLSLLTNQLGTDISSAT
jgi:Flp pilus assembly pilin Flp